MACNDSIYPPDYSTPVGQVRSLMNDVDDPYVFTDAQVQAWLAIYNDNIKLAAAQGLYTVAADSILLLKYVKTDDLLVDGQKVSSELRQLADRLHDEGQAEDALDDEFFYVTYPVSSCGWAENQERPAWA